jgi:DnaJ-domain-containing protein 1
MPSPENELSTGSDPFDLLGITPAFDVDPVALQRAWLAGSARLHPDRFSAGSTESDEARRLALLAALNHSRMVLADPFQRAEALMARLGGPSKEADKSLPEGFLMDMLEVREQLEEAAASGDAAAVGKWEDWAGEQRREAILRVAGLFKDGALAEVRRELNAWRYIERMIEQLPRE